MLIRKYEDRDIAQMILIWNEVVEEGIAFPQEDFLDEASGKEFFGSQSYTGVAEDDGKIVGLYILHPNNIGAWDIRKVIEAGENGAVIWYYEYRDNDGNSTSYDGVSVIELSDGRIKRWNEFSQPTEKTYS